MVTLSIKGRVVERLEFYHKGEMSDSKVMALGERLYAKHVLEPPFLQAKLVVSSHFPVTRREFYIPII